MIQLRHYQSAAVDALFAYFGRTNGNPLLVCPTGSGKSLIAAAFIKAACEAFPETRILLATHRAELIKQDADAIRAYWPEADVGIYSAGLGARQIRPITVAGVQSIVNVKGLPAFDLLLVDEAHLIPHGGEGQYRTLIKRLQEKNDAIKVVGLTATPYRLSGGRLTRGEGKIFSSIAYDIPVQQLVDEGHLSPLVSPVTHGAYSTASVGTNAGDFKIGELSKAVEGQAEITRAALEESAQLAADRKSWLVFCVSIEHARQAAEHLFSLGVSAQVVTGDDDMGARKAKIDAYKRGDVRALVSCDVLTVGFDAPATDCLVILRPTQSTGLWAQIAGRGMRLAPGKVDCLVLDYGENIQRHGPITALKPKESRENSDVLRFKVCPQCDAEVAKHKPECPECGRPFPRVERAIEHDRKAARLAVMGPPPEPVWIDVVGVDYSVHIKAGDPPPPPTMRARYLTGNLARKDFSEWVCPEHGGFATEKFWRWWAKRGGTLPAPTTTQEAVDRAAVELRPIAAIVVEKDGKWDRVKDVRFGERVEREPGSDDDKDDDGAPEAPPDELTAMWDEPLPF